PCGEYVSRACICGRRDFGQRQQYAGGLLLFSCFGGSREKSAAGCIYGGTALYEAYAMHLRLGLGRSLCNLRNLSAGLSAVWAKSRRRGRSLYLYGVGGRKMGGN